MIRPGVLSLADAAELSRLIDRVRSLEGTTYAAPLAAAGAPGGPRSVYLAGAVGGGGCVPVQLTTGASTTPGGKEFAALVTWSGSAWVTGAAVWLAELNGGYLPARTSGTRYLAWDSGKTATVSSVTQPLYFTGEPGLVATVQCSGEPPRVNGTITPLGV